MPAARTKSKTPSDTKSKLNDTVVNIDVLTQYSNDDDEVDKEDDSSFIKIGRVVTVDDDDATTDYNCNDDSK